MTVVVTHTTPADSTFSSTGAAAWNADHTLAGVGTMAEQNANAVAITGGTINGTTVGATTPAASTFTTLTATGTTNLGTGSANFLTAVGSAGAPAIYTQGSSANIQLSLSSKGSANLSFQTNTFAQQQLVVSHTASAVNYVQVTGAATGGSPTISAQGSDANINLNLNAKGTSGVVLNTNSIDAVLVKSSIPTILGSTLTTNLSNKYFVLASRQYTTTEVGTTLIGSENTSSANTVYIGGYYGELNAATQIDFYTAGTVATRSGSQQFRVANTSSAVNYVQVTGAATSGTPVISAQGSDTNTGMLYYSKGFGSHQFRGYNGANIFGQFFANQASPVNYIEFGASSSGNAVLVRAAGADTNIPLVLQPKGTGALQAQQTDSTATGGNVRGSYATDWQKSRVAATQVASGSYSFIGGGDSNTSAAFGSVVVGGSTNSTTGGAYNAILGGVSNVTGSNGQVITMGGGHANSAQGFFNIVGGGYANSGTSGPAVTTQSATMNGTTAVTLSGSNASIKVGQLITGTSIGTYPHTYVAAISGTSLTLSQAASGSSTSTLSFFTPHGVVVGGGNNQATGAYSVILGGGDAGTAANRNVASGDWSVVVGGQKNVASSNYSFVGGGGYNTASSGNGSVVCGGGFYGNLPTQFAGNTSSGTSSFIGAGFSNQASGFASFVGAGNSNLANSAYSVISGGAYGTTRSINGNAVFPAGASPIASLSGVSQSALLILGVETTNATATILRSDTSAASTVNQVILPNNSAYAFKGTVIANVTGGGNTKAWAIEGAIKRGANAASTALVGTPTVTSNYADAGASTWAITATADTTNGGLKITFTGQASTTIRCVAKLETTEVTF